MENKRGQQMTLGTIIAIVLGLVVLVFLIYGFSTGWGNLWERVTGFGGGDVNIDTVKTSCTLACQQNSRPGWCTQSRAVNIGEDSGGVVLKGRATCVQLQYKTGSDGLAGKDVGITCPAITCSTSEQAATTPAAATP